MSAEDEFTELYAIAKTAGWRIATEYDGYVTVDDMTQEAVLWLLEHPRRVERARLDDGTLHRNRLVAEVVTERLAPVARRERREALGDASEDQYTYSARVVEVLLPFAFEQAVPRAIQQNEGGRARGNKAEGGSFEVMVMDVRRAVERLGSSDRAVVFTRAVGGWPWAKFSEVYTTRSREWFRLRYKAILRTLVEFLNSGVYIEYDPDPEAQALEAQLDETPLSPATAGDPDEDEWHTIGRDPYREPTY